jgi:hypothetical protein
VKGDVEQLEPTRALAVVVQRELAMPNWRGMFTNLKAPMPLGRKVQRIPTNNWTKIRRRSRCCGHPGEPGC